MPNNIVLNPQSGDAVAISAISNGYSQTNAQFGTTGFATVTGVFPGGAANGLIQRAITISQFANPKNNGTFQILSSTATQLTINNPNAVAVTAVATGTYQTQSFPVQYASRITNLWSNQSGDSVAVNANAGDCLVAVVIGLKQIVDFDQLHGTAPYYPQFGDSQGTSGDYPNGGFNFGQLAGLNDFNANPTISDFGSGLPVDIEATKLSAGTLTVTYDNPNQAYPAAPSPYFSAGNVVTLTNTKEPWLNGTTVTVVTAPVGPAPGYVSTFTATVAGPVVGTLTASDGALVVPGEQTTTTYTGTITGGADDAFAGYTLTIAAFGNAANNGPFTVVSSTATQITVLNSAGVAQAGPQHVASLSKTEGASAYVSTAATYGTAGNSLSLTVDDTALSAPTLVGNAITIHTLGTTVAAYVALYPSVTTTSGTYIGVVNFTYTGAGTDLFTTAASAPFTGGFNPATATITAYTQAADTGLAEVKGNTWTLQAHASIVDSDYTVTYPFSGPLDNGVYTPSKPGPSGGPSQPTSNLPSVLTPSNAYQSSKWNIDGYYPSIYIFVAPNVKAGNYKVNLNSMYQPGINAPADYAQGGQPIFDGGVNFQVFCLSGVATASPVESFSIATTETLANPATAPGTLAVANTDGDALISVALTKSGNILAAGSTGSATPTSLLLTAVAPLTVPGSSGQYAPQNYGGAVYTGTITGGANNALVGNQFTVT